MTPKKLFRTTLIVLLLCILLFGNFSVYAQTPSASHTLYIYLFWGEGCPHCAKAKPYFESLAQKYPDIVFHDYEIYYNQDNHLIFQAMAQKFQVEQLVVPMAFIGNFYLPGYTEELNPNIEAAVLQCLQNGCINPGEGIPGVSDPVIFTATPVQQATPTPTQPIPQNSTPTIPVNPSPVPTSSPSDMLIGEDTLDIPLIGKVDLKNKSIALSTALIALVDGFNPCSLWVLSTLLALTLHTASRRKIFLIGSIFLTVTAAIYALFIAGLFSALKITGFLSWIRILVSLIALFFAVINIKDYFWFKEGLSLTIADEKKSGIYKKMRKVLDASQSLGGLIGATIALAVGVSIVEFSCTAGLPIVWVNLLNAQGVSGMAFIALLLLYMLIYQLDELLIFSSAVISLKASRVQEKHGRILKLFSGTLMLVLSLVMLINPGLMNSIPKTLLIFGVVLLLTLLVLLLHRLILPSLGVKFGSEFKNKNEIK